MTSNKLSTLTIGGTKYSMRGSIYTVIGTQTASTGAWTGNLPEVNELYDGLTIAYYLPWAGSGNATLNLTLGTATSGSGAVNCYYGTNTRLTTHFAKGCIIFMTYYSAGAISIDGTATTDARWIAHGQYYSDGNTRYGDCDTAAATAAKTASFTYYELLAKSYCIIRMRYANTAASAITMNINSKGAKPIYINGAASSTSNYTLPAGTYLVYYDGTNYYFRTDGLIPGLTTVSVNSTSVTTTATTVVTGVTTAAQTVVTGGTTTTVKPYTSLTTASINSSKGTTTATTVVTGGGTTAVKTIPTAQTQVVVGVTTAAQTVVTGVTTAAQTVVTGGGTTAIASVSGENLTIANISAYTSLTTASIGKTTAVSTASIGKTTAVSTAALTSVSPYTSLTTASVNSTTVTTTATTVATGGSTTTVTPYTALTTASIGKTTAVSTASINSSKGTTTAVTVLKQG